jgi:hypothetical protein
MAEKSALKPVPGDYGSVEKPNADATKWVVPAGLDSSGIVQMDGPKGLQPEVAFADTQAFSTDFSTLEPNVVIERTINAPLQFTMDHFCKSAVLAPGDPKSRVCDHIAAGMVRKKEMGNVIETVTAVEWTESTVTHKFRVNTVGDPGCRFIWGYGGKTTFKDLGNGQTQIEHAVHQKAKCCHPCCCCCGCLWWHKLALLVQGGEMDKVNKAYEEFKQARPGQA